MGYGQYGRNVSYSGIYKITNRYNGKIYVGQSQNIYTRRNQHFAALSGGTHENKAMQKDYNLYSRYFCWDVIEYCDQNELNEREKYWIDKLDCAAPNGYNQGWQPYKRKQEKKLIVRGYRRSR